MRINKLRTVIVQVTINYDEDNNGDFVAAALNSVYRRWNISGTEPGWNVSGEICSGSATDWTDFDGTNKNPFITCDCSYDRNTTCHITRLSEAVDVKNGHLTSLNVHRLLITCVMVAAKFIDGGGLASGNDFACCLYRFFNNAFYAKVGGVTTKELNRLEMKLLFSLDFILQVSVETFDRTCFELGKESGFATPTERPFHACRLTESWPTKGESTFASRAAR